MDSKIPPRVTPPATVDARPTPSSPPSDPAEARVARLERSPDSSTAELRRINDELRAEIAAHAASRNALDQQSEILDAFFRHTQTSLVLLDRHFNFIRVNDAYARACQREASAFPGHNHFEFYPSPLIDDFNRVVADRKVWSIAARPFLFLDHPEWGTTYWDLALVPILNRQGEVEHLVFSLHDVTPIIRTEQALRETEERYRQAQKMESIGRLAGGLAHDFNNLLSVIGSYAGFAMKALPANDPIREDLRQVLNAGDRAAALTRQLLAFSRQQVLLPVVVGLNEIVTDMETMLRRLIGEHIDLRFTPAKDLGQVLVDPGQIEQVVMNLVVNARDAMPCGGKLTIESSNVVLDGETPGGGTSLPAGEYVVLSVSDTGSGMDETTRSRVFEPFFTTKQVGKGSGLGLATVHGIVQQSGGAVTVRTEVGKGSTFLVYLPRVTSGARSGPPAPPPETNTTGHETVLVVEDEDAVRAVVERLLAGAGYDVLSAANGADALRLCEERKERIHLLLTDVIMPHVGGPELSNRLTALRPGIKTIYMSGYAGDTAALQAELQSGKHFVAKPILPAVLLRELRSVLDDRD